MNHPLFSHDQNRWVAAGRFRIGERVRTASGKAAKIREIRKVRKSHVVYNIEVHRGKSYFVGEVGVLAHNTGLSKTRAGLSSTLKKRLRKKGGFKSEGQPLILDENLNQSGFAEGLRDRGYNVRSVEEIFGRNGVLDPDIKRVADGLDGFVITRDRGRQLDGGFGRRSILIDSRIRSLDGIERLIMEALK